jgi:L-asparaginase
MIRLFITGGTIDAIYNILTAKTDYDKTHIPQIFNEARITLPIEKEELMLKDSGDITEKDRELIVKKCRDATENKILITHGTDTMVETAKALGKANIGKTIILLGSMRPFNFGKSDALFNLGTAVAAVQLKEPGVYITMNGKIFNWDNVRKNREVGQFEELH